MNWKAVTYPSFLNFHDVTIESELIHVTSRVDLNLAAIHFAKLSFCSGNHRNSLKELLKFVKNKELLKFVKNKELFKFLKKNALP